MPVLGNQSPLSLIRALYQFAGLWKYIEVRPSGVLASGEVMTRLTGKKDWKRVFEHFDKDRSGTIDGLELQTALNQFGMKLSPNLMSLVLAKFCTSAPLKKLLLELFSNFCDYLDSFFASRITGWRADDHV
jgi:EF-hand domain